MNVEELSLRTSQRLKQLRVDANMTQRDVADETGLAISYLSRLENHRVVPTITTLGRIASALEVPVEAFFEADSKADQRKTARRRECPVTISGACIMSLLAGRGGSKDASDVQFTQRRVALLRKCNYLLHRGEPELVDAFTTMLDALLTRVGTSREPTPAE